MPRTRHHAWTQLPDDELLELRLCDLRLQIPGSILAERVERLYEELAARGIAFRPPCWLTTEWFSPEGVPGIGIPFYLAHERLRELERKLMFQVEGANASWCMRLLRHEAGHAISTAYRLHYRKVWRDAFGPYSRHYPSFYTPRPASREHVLHLDWWYAQAHPAEDFAETFAVWLRPASRWHQSYADWPVALAKLELVDTLVREIAGHPPLNRRREHVDSIAKLTLPLRTYYRQRQRRYLTEEPPAYYDRDLERLFDGDPENARLLPATRYLRSRRIRIRATVAQWTGEHPYAVNQVLENMIQRCRKLRLRVSRARTRTEIDAITLTTVLTLQFMRGRHRVLI